jgi:ribosomal-protein-serine acetyltransferase
VAGAMKIRIRAYEDGDAEDLWQAVQESVPEASAWLPWANAGYSLADAREWVRSRAQLLAERREFTFAIVGRDGRFLGGCGINQIDPSHRSGNLGYWVRSSATGQGVASEAVRRLRDFAFRNTELVRLEIVCAVGNLRSQRVAERAGALRGGLLRHRLLLHGQAVDAILYTLLRPE